MWINNSKSYIDEKFILVDADEFVKLSVKEINELTFTKLPCLLVKNLQPILFNHNKFIEFLKSNLESFYVIEFLMYAFKNIHNLDNNQMQPFYDYLNSLGNIKKLFVNSLHLIQNKNEEEASTTDLEFIYTNKTDNFPRTLIYKNKYKIIRSNFQTLLPYIYKAQQHNSKINLAFNYKNDQISYNNYEPKTKKASSLYSSSKVKHYDAVDKVLVIGCEKIPLKVLQHIVKVFQFPQNF